MLACAPVRWLSGGLPLLCAAGCASARPRGVPPRAGATPAPARESLHVSVVYPGPTDLIQARDSTFLFGAVRSGAGRESLSVGGTPVPLLANGAWIAWVPLPDDTIAAFRLVARAAGDSTVQDVMARIAPRYRPPAGRAAWIDTTSFAPSGTLALPLGEGIRLAAHVAPGATVRLRLPWGATIPFIPDTLPGEPAWGVRAFATTATAYRLPPRSEEHTSELQSQSNLVCRLLLEKKKHTTPLLVSYYITRKPQLLRTPALPRLTPESPSTTATKCCSCTHITYARSSSYRTSYMPQ